MTWRILHVLDHSVPLHSGYAFRTRAILREQRRLGWQTFHLTSPKQGLADAPEEDVDDLHFYRTSWNPGAMAAVPLLRELSLMTAVHRRLEELVASLRPDVIHAHSPSLNAVPALRVGRRFGIPVVYEVRAFWEDAAVDHGTTSEGGLRYRLTRALENHALRRVDQVTTICEGLRNDMVQRGVDGAKITVIPNAVDIGEFAFGQPRDEELKRSLGLDDSTVVGFIGSFYAYEGIELLVRSMPRLREAIGDVRLLLVGGGPCESSLKAQVRELGLEAIVLFAGRVPHADVQRYYSVVDVFAYPRKSLRLTELVTPLKPLEAMAQGHVFVASDVGGHRELIRSGDTGVLFKAGSTEDLVEALATLLADRPTQDRLRQNGRRFVESERTWTNSVTRYAEVYERLVRKEARGRAA